MKTKLTIIFTALLAILIFIPLPALAVKILYYLDVAFGFIILEICIFVVFSKNKIIPVFLGPLCVCLSLFTMTLDISTTRYVMIIKDINESVAVLSDFAKGFINFPYAGYVIFVLFTFLAIFTFYKKTTIEDENLINSFKFIRGTLKTMYLVFLVSLLGGTIIGISQFSLALKDSFLVHLPFACAQITMYLLAFLFAGIGLDILMFVKQNKIKYFN